jgi:hypothetical protein
MVFFLTAINVDGFYFHGDDAAMDLTITATPRG